MAESLYSRILAVAAEQGASGAGVCDVAPFTREHEAIESRKSAGRSGPLHFTYDDPGLATGVTRSFPWAERLVVVSWDYLGDSTSPGEAGPAIARFASSDHYERLRRITGAIADALNGDGYRAEVLIDDNRLIDRGAAVRAGIGWWGRSTMVLAPGHGPWLLLGTVVTDAPLPVSEPMRRGCGTCVACLPACPTGALSGDGLDARRCLSTWLQAPGSIPHWIRPRLARRIYGCDDCLTACPPGKRALEKAGQPEQSYDFASLLALSDEELLDRLGWLYVPRREGRFLRRNLLVAAGNSAEPAAWPVVKSHLAHPSSMIRGHAAWAAARGSWRGAHESLRDRFRAETVPEARDEMALSLLMMEHPTSHRAVVAADEWVSTRSDLRGLALMGSHAVARGSARSDVDLLVLADDPGHVAPPASLGAPVGASRHLNRAVGHTLAGQAVIDLVVGPLDWPTDGGGRLALDAGVIRVNDPERRLERLRSGS